jgi:hypothetical protein
MNKQDYKRAVSDFNANINPRNHFKYNILNIEKNNTIGKKALRKPIITTAIVFSFILLFIFSIFNVQKNSNSNLRFSGFTLTAYAAGNSNSVLTPAYLSDTLPTALTPNVKIVLPEYSPLLSSVPGIPFTIGLKNPDEMPLSDIQINISTDNGDIETWNQTSGVVKNNGKNFTCKAGDTIYWSPLSDGSIVKTDTAITVSAIKYGKETGKQKMIIKIVNDTKYTVELDDV